MSKKESNIPWIGLVAGAIAGSIEAAAMWPLEYVKTQMQLQTKEPNPRFRGPWHCGVTTIKETGFLSLYRGLSPVLIGALPKAGVRFGAFEQIKSKISDENGKMTPGKNFAAGLGAGICEGALVVTVVETLKTRLMADQARGAAGLPRHYTGVVNCVQQIVKYEGVGGLYKGLLPTILKQGSNQGVRFLAYNEIKGFVEKLFAGKTVNGNPNPIVSALSGSLAGFCSTVVNQPFDTVKSRMQGLDATEKYGNSTLRCFTYIIKHDGVLYFYKGMAPRLSRVIIGQGILFTVYEHIYSTMTTYFKN